MNELFRRTNIFFKFRIHLLPEKWEKIIASDGKYFE